jgi:hypothetical protein
MKDQKSDGEDVDTNAELVKIMEEQQLTVQDVADLIEVSYATVINWGRISRHSAMPRVALLALRLSIAAKDAGE